MDRKSLASLILKLAGVYNIVWGAVVVLFPFMFFDWAGLARPTYPEIWQCVGMIVGVYGLGYWLASYNPLNNKIIVLVGFLGKIFGPIGFIQALYVGTFNLKFGTLIIFNDLIWWLPFAYILMSPRPQNLAVNPEGNQNAYQIWN